MRIAYLSALALSLAFTASAVAGCKKQPPPPPPPPENPREWQLLASELPTALLSVSGRSPADVYAVGADKGHGPLVLHFDGAKWTEVRTGTRGDLWWVQTFADGSALMAGAGATVLRVSGTRFECVPTPGDEKQTVYGVWGKSADDFYAVGSAEGKNGFVWHATGPGRTLRNEPLPADLPPVAGGGVPGFFKVFGTGDDVWIVGAGGTILHRHGGAPFAVVRTTTKETLFTVHGAGDRLLAVGGSGNGVLLASGGGGSANDAFRDQSPQAAGLLQGVFASDAGDWASGERGSVYSRAPGAAAFGAVDHGLELPAASSLHSIWVDSAGGVWSAGGNVLTTSLDNGMLVHYGPHVPPVLIEDEVAPIDAGARCPTAVVLDAGKK
jgi:hypothetical protein